MSPNSKPKVAIVIYSMYGHILKMAESVKEGIVSKGGEADIYQVQETLSDEILTKMSAPPKSNYPIATPETLTKYGAFIFGIPTRYGNMPAQLKTFWDATGKLWAQGSLSGKYAGVFVGTSGPGGGQEMTVLTFMSTLVHHGMIFVPLGYATGYAKMVSLDEVHGGSPWGAGTFAGPDGARFPTERELEIAKLQGQAFYEAVSRVKGL
ncbi:Protoplast secreted protein 2 [Psilocybe cubensis]|uniref:Protoplast secreted protein 2 n=2 Tax=Psilocybe cubensis TaxID=181762 RepID=A0ACB8GUE6_PSICU|nr:Protoplast secreted protein 2 [Psilocybe cubensis]KAH9479143.1 Protoplast secreted protein 2 [Psilocybe cubensis]